MTLIDRRDLLQAVPGKGFPASSLAGVLMSTLKIHKVNQLYADNCEKDHLEFLDGVLGDLEVKFEINEAELSRIPKTGAFITVSNHPFGGVDGLLLMKIICAARGDFKCMVNFLLQRVEPLRDYLFPVNPFENHQDVKSSVGGIKQAFRHIKEGHPLGIFPAGEVSTLGERIVVQDKQWNDGAIKFIKKAEVPVVPIYFHGNNSVLFHLLAKINPLFRTAKLPSELFNKKKKKITIRIGTPISVEEQSEFTDISQYGRYLRAKTYALGSALRVRKFYHNRPKKAGRQEEIIDSIETQLIESEIAGLKSEHRLFESKNYQMFCAPATRIPNVLNEIGRLREITFREVGEGTDRSTDLDEFDLYYEHLFIWDAEARRIVGAYRIGKGHEIIRQFGKRGFYIHSLFHLKDGLLPVLENSLELGRSFIVKDYQKKPASLFLLWKGILYFLLKNREYRYLIGPVSVSNNYSKFSRSLITDFVRSHYFHQEYAALIRPRKRFKVNYRNVDGRIMLDSTKKDLNKLDKIISEIEPSHFKMPVLFKKYLKQNARIMGFNVDPRFSQALDGLMILDLFDVPEKTIRSLSKELKDDSIMERFTQCPEKAEAEPVLQN